ncbi:MAG: hypothetical protein ACXW31_08110 [Thermoanaerobaculia bacterium]
MNRSLAIHPSSFILHPSHPCATISRAMTTRQENEPMPASLRSCLWLELV